jgi:polyhydroxybutyrate depolymerase
VRSVGSVALFVAAGTLAACNQGSSGSSNPRDAAASGGAASGGASSMGGSAGSGGASATGGRAGSGGAPGSGGASTTGGGGSSAITATGGTVASGGTTGSGGTTSSGGITGTGGVTGVGGATGSGGSADAGTATKDATPTDVVRADADALAKDVASPDATDASPQTCTTAQVPPKAGDSTVTVQSGGRSRSYVLHAPSGLTAGTPVPVVIDLHGAGGNGKQQQGMSGFASLADKEKFLAVFPDGVDGYWNVDDTCRGTAGKQKIDDVGFLKAIVAKLNAETCIDPKRVYVSGFSNGGGLAHRMGCDAADVIAAIAPTATDLRTQPCTPARAISMMEVKGMADSLEPYGGGLVGPAGGQYVAVGAKESLRLWAVIDQCTDTTTTTIDTYCESHTRCADGVETDLCSLPNTDHSPYANSLGFNVASVIWKMFQRQPMR